ncbi:TetR/AcrR family transcriptional regulator [Thiohalocapsa sp.]|uniref:TetR/AcrR family transcriptional regulator n=1 Tax=Thiohalocapsa sp. TaxID=2497641 RepID=UPI0025EE050D|nr:TetR/AcrR family transcriptional regulator [Thiohalocapsa sp.]
MSGAAAAVAGRPGRPKSEEKHAAILQAASRLFLDQGLQGTSMDQVARAAGVSKQTVYSHFDGKEDLFRRCIRCKVESYGFDGVSVPAGDDARAVLLAVAKRFMGLIFDPEVVAMHRVVMAEAAAHPRIAALFFENGPAATQRTAASVLTELVRRGLLRPHDTDAAAWQLLNLCFGSFHVRLLLHLIDSVPPAELDAHLKSAIADFVRLHGEEPPADAGSSDPRTS